MFVVWPDIGINVSSMLLRCEQGHTTFFLINMYLICQFKHVPRINLVHLHDYWVCIICIVVFVNKIYLRLFQRDLYSISWRVKVVYFIIISEKCFDISAY